MDNIEYDVDFEYLDCGDEEGEFDDIVKKMKDKFASITYNEIKKIYKR